MSFKNNLKKYRLEANLKQTELAKLVGMTDRTIQNYESGSSHPKTMEAFKKFANALNVSTDDLLTDKDIYIIDAYDKGGDQSAKDIQDLITDISGLFSGGSLDDSALDGAMRALNDAYWIAKEKNANKKS